MRRRHPGLAALLASLAFAGIAAAAEAGPGEKPAPLTLTGENTVILDRSTYAGQWLQFYLIRAVAKHPDFMSYAPAEKGADRAAAPVFPLLRDAKQLPAGKHVLAVGPYQNLAEYLTDEDKARMAEKPGTVLIRRRGEDVVIAGNGGPWDFAPTRIFLDKCAGVRLYAPTDSKPSVDELWLSEPKAPGIVIGDLDIFMKPYFAKATFSSGGYKRNAEWLRMNTVVSEGLDLRASHTIINYFKPEKYYDKHPQLYPMTADGRRPRPIGGAWNPCFADPDLSAKIAMDEVRALMKSNRPPTYLSFAVMDCRYDCHCPVCAQSLKEHKGDAANLWYAFLNKVAKQCQKEFPNLYLTNYAYSNVNIPTGMTIEPNIVVDNVIKSYRVTDTQVWEGEKRGILAFAALGARWVTHDWNFEGVTPRIYSRQLASFLQWGAQNGMLGIYTEWSGHEYWYVTGAHYWVLRQLLSDPYQDPDALWRQYCQDMYGDGWEEMYRFYDMFQQKHVVHEKYCVLADWARQESIAFTPEDLAAQRGWLETAIARTKDHPLIQKRLAAVMRYFRAHELLALATGVPGRLYHQYTEVEKQTGINKDALAFYVNDDGSKLLAFDEYHDTQRTLPPDSNIEDQNSGIRFSYRNNYSRALGTIIQAIKAQAVAGVDLEQANEKTVAEIVAKARDIFRANLPAKRDPKRTAEVEALIQKILWVPRVAQMPVFDGDLSDPVWAKAAKLTDWTQADIFVPTKEGNETEGRIMRVGDSLVIGLACSQPLGIWAETPANIETGTRIWRESSCEIFFGPPAQPGEKADVFQYIVNSNGAFRGFRAAADNRKGVQCAVKVADDKKSYTIEAVLPLKVEGRYDYSQGRVFSFNVMRSPLHANTFNPKERIGWAPIFFTAQYPESRGLVFLE